MNDYSAVAPPQNSQSSAFSAALQRAKQIAAKLTQNYQDPQKKRSLEDGQEPEPKKLAPVIPEPIVNHRGNTTPGIPSSIGDSPVSRPSGPTTPNNAVLGGICNEDIRVPDKMVGLIIGRGGEQITRLQSETGCKIQMAAESGGLPERTCTLTGSREAVNRAKDLVLSIVNQRKPGEDLIPGTNPPYPGPTGPATSTIMSGHPGFVEIMIPGPKVGLIIGKGGETIKQLQEKSGAKMVVIQEGPAQEQEKPLRITGDPQKVEHAKQLVYELIAEKEMQMYNRGSRNAGHNNYNQDGHTDGNENKGRGNPRGNGFNSGRPNEYGGWDGRRQNDMTGKIEFSYPVPSNKCGIIIGKGGETIKQINQQTGAHCELDRRNPGTDTDKFFTIRGTPEQVEHAKRIFSEKLGGAGMVHNSNMYGQNPMGYNPSGWNAAPGYQAWPGQAPTGDPNVGSQAPVQINPATGQPDYSAQWVEYYRSMGMHREAEMIEQQAKQQGGGPKPDMNHQGGGQPQGNQAPSGPGAPQSQPQQQQPQPQPQPQQQQPNSQQNGGQADYSAQWAEYYRSIGKIKEAEAIEAQMKSGKTGGGMQGNQMSQPQQQQQPQQMQPNPMANQGGGPGGGGPGGAPPNAFPQPYGGYPGMNPASAGGYYTPGAQSAGQPGQPGQQNPSFPGGGYQNYQYPQATSDN